MIKIKAGLFEDIHTGGFEPVDEVECQIVFRHNMYEDVEVNIMKNMPAD